MARVEVPREYVRAVPLLGSTTTLGADVRAQFSAIEPQIGGHPVHVLGFFLRLIITVNTVANTMGAACPGEKLYDALTFRFRTGDHEWIRGLRGAVVKQIERALGLRSLTGAIASDLADADATGSSVTLDYYIPCALPRGAAGAELDGAIPLALLRDEDFSFTLPSASTIPHTGVTVATVTSVNLYARLMPLSKLRVPTPWAMRERRATELVFTEEGAGFWDAAFVTVMKTEQDSLNCANFTGLRIAIGAGSLRDVTTTELTYAHNARQLSAGSNADTESVSAPEVLYIVEPISTNPGRLMTRQPKGPIKVEITARPTSVTTTDFAYRARGVRTPAYLATVRERLGAPRDGVTSHPKGAKGKVPAELVPHFDTSLSWPGMPFGVPDANQR